MDSEFNSMEDLAFSRSFRNWVLDPDSVEKAFWENWIARNPDKAGMVRQARALILALRQVREAPGEEEVDEEVKKALSRLRDAPRYLPADSPERLKNGRGLRSPMVAVAALLFLGVGIAAVLLVRAHLHRNVLRSFLVDHGYRSLKVTAGAREETFRLPDGSLVRLGPKTTLYYPGDGQQARDSREVYLDGDAYFDIRNDATAPFYVYTERLVTRVLGTRLLVRDAQGGSLAEVTAVSGRVSVYRADDFYDHSPGHEPGLLLTRNQAAVEYSLEDRLEKTVAASPLPAPDQPDTGLVFFRTPVNRVFSRLEGLYGISIQYDKALPDSCTVTANLDGGSFYQQIGLVCQAIGGSYAITDGSVVVSAGKIK